jgi:integrase/recombinase XerD
MHQLPCEEIRKGKASKMINDPQILLQNFLDEQDAEEGTLRNYRNTIKGYMRWLIINGISFWEAKKPHIIRYKNDFYDRGRSTLTINTYLSALKKFYRWLDENGNYQDITAGVKGFKKYNGFKKLPLDQDDVLKLLSNINEVTLTGRRDHLIIHMMIISGFRSCEITRLSVADFIDNNTPGLMVMGKGSKVKTFARISALVAEELRKYLNERPDYKRKAEDPLFETVGRRNPGERISVNTLGMMIKKRMTGAGLDAKLSAHSLRHTTAVMMILQGASLYDVQCQLRHTDANMTRNYLRYLDEQKRIQSPWMDKLENIITTPKAII